MKSIIRLMTVALFLNNGAAIRQKDLGDLDLPTLTDENDIAQDKKLVQ